MKIKVIISIGLLLLCNLVCISQGGQKDNAVNITKGVADAQSRLHPRSFYHPQGNALVDGVNLWAHPDMILKNIYPELFFETPAEITTNKNLDTLFNNYWEERSKLFPLDATQFGDNRYNNQLPNDQTHAYRDTLKAFYQSYLDSVKAFDRNQLTDENKISYDIFLYNMNMELKGLALNTWMMPFSQVRGLPGLMGIFGSGSNVQPFKTVKDYDNWLGRIKGFTVWADSAIGNFKQGMAFGVVLPKALVVRMIPQMENLMVTNPVKSLFYKPVANLPKDFSDADKQRIADAYKQAITTEIVPTYKKLADFLKNEYLPKAQLASGIGSVPGGKEMYDYDVQYWTTTDETPEQIYQTGLSEVKRINGLMDSVRNAIGFKGDLKALFQYMNTDKRFFPFKTPQQVLDTFEAIHKKIEPNVKKLYGHFPKTPFEIRQVEEFREKSVGVPQYQPGSPDGSRPGIFYVPIPDPVKFTTPGMETVFLHVAIPGHHYQLSLQQEDTLLPNFRRFGDYGAYTEGYALYCESLGKELGVYTDPFQYLGSLKWDMHRAVRLVVDVAIHTKGMTREEAIKYMMSQEPIDEHTATTEIERYMARPGQALSYKAGQLKIRELRNKYEKELGNRFNLSNFHDELLSGGSMPLKILEEKMDAWATRQK